MAFNLKDIIDQHVGKEEEFFGAHINPQLTKVLKTIGFCKSYRRAQGAYLYDEEGNRYLDLLAGYGVFALGRNHPEVKDALQQAMNLDLPNMVQMDTPLLAGILARRLLKLIGGKVDTIFFTNSGTEANEGAIKFAKRYTKRPRILFWDHAFHGLTTGSLALNGNEEFKKGFGPLLPGATMIPFNDINALEHEISKGDVAAFIFEPIQGKGVNVPNDGFYERAAEICAKYGTLMIADEVQTGFGRTGKVFAHHHWKVQPDIVTVAKALSGGFIPIGAIAYNKTIYNRIFSNLEECVIHSNTFGRNIMAATAGLVTLEIMERDKVVENSKRMGDMIVSGLNQMKHKFEMIKEIRGRGLMIAIEFGSPKSLRLKASWMMLQAAKKGLFAQLVTIPLMKDYRILTQVAGHNIATIKLLPPLIIDENDVKYFLTSFEAVMEDCHKLGATWRIGKELALAAAKSSRLEYPELDKA